MNFPIKNLKQCLLVPLMLGTVLLPGRLSGQLLHAHETQVKGSLAAIWHIEPNDAPEAGKSAKVWVALTRAGGKIVPLADCDCALKIWTVPRGEQPLLEPELTAITAEHYTGIPAADVIFPNRGHYELEIQGTPKDGADFEAFDFTTEILVATGTDTQSVPVQPSPAVNAVVPDAPEVTAVTAVSDSAAESGLSWILLGASCGIAIVVGLQFWIWKKDQP